MLGNEREIRILQAVVRKRVAPRLRILELLKLAIEGRVPCEAALHPLDVCRWNLTAQHQEAVAFVSSELVGCEHRRRF